MDYLIFNLLIMTTTIDTALIVENITEQKLMQLEQDYTNLAITPITNDAELDMATEAKRDLRTTRTTAVKICKAGREEAVSIQRMWLDKEKSIVSRVEAIEKPLDENIDAYKAIAEKKRLEEEAEKKIVFRKNIIDNAGITAPEADYKYLDDASFQAFFQSQCLLIQEAKALKEKQEQEEKDREVLKKQAAEDALKNAYKDIRHKTMVAMGFQYAQISQQYIFEIVNFLTLKVTEEEVMNQDELTFTNMNIKSQNAIDNAKKQRDAAAVKALTDKAEAEANQKIAADAERTRLAKKAEDDKLEAIKIADIKKKALAPDKDKLTEFVQSINPDYPIVATEEWRVIVARAKQLFTLLSADLIARIEKL